MKVFHGSYTEIESVDLSKCQANKDFGRKKQNTNSQNLYVRMFIFVGHK
jgi:hypothetical protein